MTDDNHLEMKHYFGLDDSVMNAPSWLAWENGWLSMKPFSKHVRECRDNGTLYLERCSWCDHYLLLCKKYGGECRSSKCKDERIELARQKVLEKKTQ